MRLAGEQAPAVLVAHLGYGRAAAKRAHAVTAPDSRVDGARLVAAHGTSRPLTVSPPAVVAGWSPLAYHSVAFDEVDEPGDYRVEFDIDGASVGSAVFRIDAHRLPALVVADITAYLRGARSSGEIERKDRHARFYGDDSGREVDARGGWLDASGDYSKFLSHLTYTRMMSPQQIPLVAWALAQAGEELRTTHPGLRTSQHARLRDEALHGADFLVRFQAPEGYFYTGIFDALTKVLDERVITAPLQDSVRTQRWQAAYRHGGGMAIAALARAARLGESGDFTAEDYWAAAVRGFVHLEEHNAEYLFDGQESVIDDYCALMAAVELLHTGRARGADTAVFEGAARSRVGGLIARWRTDAGGVGYLEGDVTGSPYFHAAEAGLPVIALLRAAEALAQPLPALAAEARSLALRLLEALVARTDAVANPFGYPRQLTRPLDGAAADAFFYPHENETGYWWQGENAGISSLAYACLLGSRTAGVRPELAARLARLADDVLGWVTGLNPFDSCMLQGRGHGSLEYSGVYQNSPGGILNGITSGFSDEAGIAYLPEDAPDGEEWRWAEQWIPHTAWFVLAVCAAR
jgi:hypothetical protein